MGHSGQPLPGAWRTPPGSSAAAPQAGFTTPRPANRIERSGGSHIYPIVQDARDIPRVIDAIFDTLWANGFGWSLVSKGGAVLTRGLIDASVGSPERPIFEGAPAVMPPLAQDKSRRATAIDGEILDTRAAFPDLTAEIKQRAEQARAEWRARLKPEAEKVQKAQTEERVEKVVRKAKANNQPPPDRDRLRRELMLAYEENSLLPPDFELEFDDPAIGVVTVAEVLSDRARFIGQTLADPLEGPTYGRCKALVMEDRFSGGLFIKSFAHGGHGLPAGPQRNNDPGDDRGRETGRRGQCLSGSDGRGGALSRRRRGAGGRMREAGGNDKTGSRAQAAEGAPERPAGGEAPGATSPRTAGSF